jgi:hypothetical protein
MSRTLLAIVGLVAFLFGASGASAFTTHPVDPVITFDRQADPDQFLDKASNGQSGGTTFALPGGLPGGFKLQFSGPSTSTQHRDQPICRVPKYGIRADRTSVVGSAPELCHWRKSLPTGSTCGKSASHRSSKRAKAAVTLGITAQYEISYRRLKT